jgi:hypothetical protein
MKEETFNDEMAASKERELHSEAKIHTKRFSALRLGMGALFSSAVHFFKSRLHHSICVHSIQTSLIYQIRNSFH